MLRIIPLVLALVLIGAACNKQDAEIQKPKYSDGFIKIVDKEISFELAESSVEKSRGLSGRMSIEENQGMLFMFPVPDFPIFWMKGMHFPIDIVWLKDDEVVDITADIQHEPGVANNQLKTYVPKKPANRVLELKAGWAARNSLKIGDKVEIIQVVE